MTESSLTLRAGLAPWHSGREAVRAVLLLAAREVRTASRTPAYLVPNLLVPIFFYFVIVGSLGEFAGRFGIENWEAFQLPMAIVFAVQGGSAGLNLVADIESGYFEKLLSDARPPPIDSHRRHGGGLRADHAPIGDRPDRRRHWARLRQS